MPRICFVLVAGLDDALLRRTSGLSFHAFPHRTAYEPAFPAVTSTAQATLTTGATAGEHGIICNGLYTRGHADIQSELDLTSHADARTNVSFWEQSGGLVQRPRFWEGTGKKVAMLFWQNSMPWHRRPADVSRSGPADIVLTPKPVHTPDGKTMTACWSNPADLYGKLEAKLGAFPLHNYWSPMAGLASSKWIAQAAEHVWRDSAPDLQLVYLPHLDYNLMRLGPSHAALPGDLAALDAILAPLAAAVRKSNGTLIVAGDYGMTDVSTPIFPNRALREAGLFTTLKVADDKLNVAFDRTPAFVMADHQVAFLYARPDREAQAIATLAALPGVDRVIPAADLAALGLATPRAGNALLLAKPDAWFAHDWWVDDEEKPAWQFSVDIHNKPGFDPRELFFDPKTRRVAQNAALVKGSHGLTNDNTRWPVLLSDTPLPTNPRATDIAPFLQKRLT